MNKEIENRCKDYIWKYYNYKQEWRKIKVRNELYVLMKKDIDIWIKSIFSRWGRNLDQTEIISLSWDAFLFSLKRYNLEKSSGLPKYFFEAIRYFLLMEFAREDKVRIKLEELKEVLVFDDAPENICFDRLLTLQQFRDVIPEKYKIVWDDAFYSLCDNPSERRHTKDLEISQAVYFPIKEVLKGIISLILLGK